MDIGQFIEKVRKPEEIFNFEDYVTLEYKQSKCFLLKDIFNDDIFKLFNNQVTKCLEQIDDCTLTYSDFRTEIDISKNLYFNTFNNELSDPDISSLYIQKFERYFGWDLSEITEIGFSIWCDNENYYIPLHYDTNVIKYSIQSYLSEYKEGMGTCLSYTDKKEDTFVNFGFKQNGGYAMKNTNQFYHGLEQKVPKDYKRLSMYFRLM